MWGRSWFTTVRAGGALLVAIVLMVGTGNALGQDLTGVLYGKVAAEDGAVLPGVTVTISSPALIKGQEIRVTGPDGTYRVPALPPGVYSIRAELSGFRPVNREKIVVGAGLSLGVDFVLNLAAYEEKVTVVAASPLVDVRSAETSRTVDRLFVENTPTGRSFADLLVVVPGVVDADYKNYPAQSVHGGTPRQNNYNVDGATATDPSGGYMAMEIPYDMLEEVQVTVGGFSAEYGQTSGAVVNFITKSGGNTRTGEVSFYGENKALNWSNLDDELRRQGMEQGTEKLKQFDYGFALGGAIKTNRLWYFGNVRRKEGLERRPDFLVKDRLTVDTQGFVKLTSQLTSKMKLEGSFTIRPSKDDPGDNADWRTAQDPRTVRDTSRLQSITNLGLMYVLSDRTLLDARLSQSMTDISHKYGADNAGYEDIVTGLYSRGWTTTDGKQYKRDKRGLKIDLSHYRDNWLVGTHAFKTGFYAELADFARFRTMYDDTYHLLRNGAPYRVRLYNTPSNPKQAVTVYAGYLQDEWTINDRVTLSLGVRFESTEGWRPATTRGGGRWDPLEQFPEERDLAKWFNASPRVGIVWAPGKDKRTAVRLNLGRYYNALMVGEFLPQDQTGAGYREYDWNDLNADMVFQDGEQRTLRRDTRAAAAPLNNPDLRRPHVDGLQVAFDRQIGADLSFSVTGIYKRERDLPQQVDLAIPRTAYNALTLANPINGEPITIYALKPEYQGVQPRRMLVNPTDPAIERKYRGVEFALNKRMSNRWQFQGSVALGRSEGNMGNSFGASTGTGLYVNPNSLVNAYGPLDMDAPVQFRILGTYIGPGDIMFSTFYTGISGYPISLGREVNFDATRIGSYVVRFFRTDDPRIISESSIDVRGDKRGSHRFPFRNKLSLRAEKGVQLRRAKLSLMVDLFNVLNNNATTAVENLNFGEPNFMKPSEIETPRAVRLGVRLQF